MANKVKNDEYLQERQAGRDKYRIAYLETYHNCIESDIALTILKKNIDFIAAQIKLVRMRQKKIAATNSFSFSR